MRHTASRRLVLASSSPRRRELLALLSLPFEVVEPPLEEASLPIDKRQPPEIAAERLAIAKAQSVCDEREGLVIGADTIVVLDEEILGKPKGPEDAEAMLRRLRGREHSVVTGIAVLQAPKGSTLISYAKTAVVMRHYSDREMADYIASGEPMDKAGAYAIQDPVFRPVKSVDGCYLNVVGLPLCALSSLLIRAGVPVFWKPPINLAYCTFCRAPPSRLESM